MITNLIGVDLLCMLLIVYYASIIFSLLVTVILRQDSKIEALQNICVCIVLTIVPVINTLYIFAFLIIEIIDVIRDIWRWGKCKKILPYISEAFKIGTYVKLFKEIKEK